MNRVSAEFLPGEIHAVLGENGAGKSTLMGILAGFVTPDSGSVSFGAGAFPYGKPAEAKRLGIELVHQHFMLVPEFTVAENLALYRTSHLGGAAHVERLAEPALELGKSLGWSLDPAAKTGALPVGTQQRVEILKALSGRAPVVMFDEPTAVLSPEEVLDLFRVLRTLRDQGKTLILIAHKLSEVMAIADRVTVLRRGQWVASSPLNGLTPAILAEWMVGEVPVPVAQPTADFGEPIVRASQAVVRGDRGEEAIRSINFEIRQGEILGFGGVDGNGQVELAEALAGVRPATGLQVETAKTAYIPQDRQLDGLALDLSILENLALGGYRRFSQGPLLKPKPLNTWAEGIVKRYGIKVGRLSDPVKSLSGGNQQKVVVGRSLDETPGLIVAVNPTRGLDVKAAQAVHTVLRECAEQGSAIALISTDLDELAALAHRTVFLSRGQLTEGFSAEALTGG